MPLEIVTLAQFKTYLGITSSTEDTNLQTILDAVNQFVETYCHRSFEEAEYVELYDGTGTTSLILRHRPVTEITEILIYDDEITMRTEVGGDGYYYKDLASGIIMRDDLWDRGQGIITVTYTAGYTDETIPADLRYAVYELATYFRNTRKKAGMLSETLGSYSYRLAMDLGSMGGGLTIPNVVVKNILDRYREDYYSELVY